jgi:hypothetical protein
MHRIRMSLPYFKEFGYEAEVVTVDPFYSDLSKDELLLKTVPADILIHYVKAFDKAITSKFGFGNIALRSMYYYRKKVNSLLRKKKYDLIYFSTTQFPICILGAYWKKKFMIPYAIDMQDPWNSNYYKDKPKEQQPKKYWFSYRLNKFLEPIAIKNVSGLISVSENYIEDLKDRYPEIRHVPSATIPFGAFEPDLKIAAANNSFKSLLQPGFKNIVYVGRGGMDMHKAIAPLFESLENALKLNYQLFSNLKFCFIGTSYAPAGQGSATITPLAKHYNVEKQVIELTDRISYYHTLITLQQADALFIPGSDDPKYTASKIYPYLLAQKPLLTIFNKSSAAIPVLHEYGVRHNYSYDLYNLQHYIYDFLNEVATDVKRVNYNLAAFKKYSAQMMTKQQSDLLNHI